MTTANFSTKFFGATPCHTVDDTASKKIHSQARRISSCYMAIVLLISTGDVRSPLASTTTTTTRTTRTRGCGHDDEVDDDENTTGDIRDPGASESLKRFGERGSNKIRVCED
eukprot:TRINITY_DN53387_c0_g1_i1.p1 TRINITY_DN53387_c0_g1~~TRINITY_DN53387_c0_g1_i1.p1  ORF type:complete len:112 (+),score=6.56 TRINITY_DN53387_c0_g1_i1:14-349(+)